MSWTAWRADPAKLPPLFAKLKARYRLGAKADSLDQQLADVRYIDCSGAFRLIAWKFAGAKLPDGSWHQARWLDDNGFKVSDVASAKLKDGHLRAFQLPPSPGRVGHIGFVLDGKTYESYGGQGAGSREWNGAGWQGRCKVWVLARKAG